MSRRRRGIAVVASVVALGAAAEGASALYADGAAAGGNAFTADILQPPTALLAIGGSAATLTWVPTLDAYAAGYRVRRASSSGGPFAVVATVTPRTTTLHIDSPPGSGTWYYRVEAFSGSWTSAPSNQVSAFVL